MISSDEREAKHNSQKIFPQDPSCWFFTARTDSVCLIGQLSRRIRASLSARSYNLLPVFDHILQITCNCAGGADGYRASNSRQLFGQRLLHSDFKENDPASDSTRASGEAPYSIGRSYQPRQKINAIILFLFSLLFISTSLSLCHYSLILQDCASQHETRYNACEGLLIMHDTLISIFYHFLEMHSSGARNEKCTIRTNTTIDSPLENLLSIFIIILNIKIFYFSHTKHFFFLPSKYKERAERKGKERKGKEK